MEKYGTCLFEACFPHNPSGASVLHHVPYVKIPTLNKDHNVLVDGEDIDIPIIVHRECELVQSKTIRRRIFRKLIDGQFGAATSVNMTSLTPQLKLENTSPHSDLILAE